MCAPAADASEPRRAGTVRQWYRPRGVPGFTGGADFDAFGGGVFQQLGKFGVKFNTRENGVLE
jgi:hypothetical protein